jgi:hypothetical protein
MEADPLYSLAYFHSTPKGKQKERIKVISESGVKLQFLSNQFGVFEIHGTTVGSEHEGDPAFNVELRKNIKRLQMQHQLLHQEGKMQVEIKYKKESRRFDSRCKALTILTVITMTDNDAFGAAAPSAMPII